VASVLLVPEGPDLFLFEGNPRTEVFRTWVSDDVGYTWSENIQVSTIRRHFPRDTNLARADGAWVLAYSAHTAFEPNEGDPNENTEIFWQRSEDLGQTWSTEERMLEDPTPSIQPVMAADAFGNLHLVWADMTSGAFEIVHAASTDGGQSFSTPLPLTFDSVGAWEPTIAADGERLYVAWSEFDALDAASIHLAALDGDTLVGERQLSTAGHMARQPHITPLGDCTSWITWSESDLQGPWELGSAVVATAGLPVSEAEGSVLPAVLLAGEGAQPLTITLRLELGEDDRGTDLIEVLLPEPLVALDGTATLDVDGDPVDGHGAFDGRTLWFQAEDAVQHDGAQLDLRLDVDPGPSSVAPDPLQIWLHQGNEPCAVQVVGDLQVLVSESGDDDDDETPADDDETSDPTIDGGCECSASGDSSGWLAPALLLLALSRRRTSALSM
jgi:MYXO-CTERM domain-containing protein